MNNKRVIQKLHHTGNGRRRLTKKNSNNKSSLKSSWIFREGVWTLGFFFKSSLPCRLFLLFHHYMFKGNSFGLKHWKIGFLNGFVIILLKDLFCFVWKSDCNVTMHFSLTQINPTLTEMLEISKAWQRIFLFLRV